jgi:protein required for attachment to host cells
MQRTWVVVADSARARIFQAKSPVGPLIELDDQVHPESRLRALDINADRPGRTHDSAGRGRHAMESEVSPREQDAREFARELADRLDKARAEGLFGNLVLVAAPAFLGLLREALPKQTRERVTFELDKYLVTHSPADIRAHLPYRI